MGDKFMQIHNDHTQNYPFRKLQLVFKPFGYLIPTTQNTIKVPKVESTDKKTLFKNFGDQCNKQPNVPSLPGNNTESTLVRSDYQPPTLVRYSRPRGNTYIKPLPLLIGYFNVFCQFFANKPKIFQIQFFSFQKTSPLNKKK